jgi:hypothetical protein
MGAPLRVRRHFSRDSIAESMMFDIYCFGVVNRASPLANRASKARLNAPAAPTLSITIKSVSWRFNPEAEKFAAPVRSNRPSI